MLIATDGAASLIVAVKEYFPKSLRQRYLAHKVRNLMSKVPEATPGGVQAGRAGGLPGAVCGDGPGATRPTRASALSAGAPARDPHDQPRSPSNTLEQAADEDNQRLLRCLG